MVAGINGFSLGNLDSIQNELKFVSTDEFGDITQETQAKLTSDASKAVDRFGVNYRGHNCCQFWQLFYFL
jgi:hypothetical protein